MQMTNILGPIVVITAIGYLLGRSSVGLEAQTLSALVILVATPALLFNRLTAFELSPDVIGSMAKAAFLCLSIAGGMGLIALKFFKRSVRSFLPSLMFPNSGNMGLPLAILTFGDQGALLGVAYFFVVALVQHSLGLSIYAGSVQPKTLMRQPLIYAVIAVLLVMWFSISVPQIILTTTDILGGMMVPAMLLLLGTSLATLKVTALGPAAMVATGRLLIGVLSAVLVILVLDLRGVPAGVVFLLATMPTAIVNYVLAERYNFNSEQVAGSVVASTLLTFLCLPALVWAALAISKLTVPFSAILMRNGA